MITSVHNLLDALSEDRSLREPHHLSRRVDAVEQLESWLADDGASQDPSFRTRAKALAAELEAVDQRLYQAIRDDIRAGKGARTLLEWAASTRRHGDDESYGPLDTLLGGVLDFREPGDVLQLDADMVFYQPTPAHHIFDFIARASLSERDVVVDLGSGLGHVALLAAICTHGRCIGIELQPAYVASARQCARVLNVRNVEFVEQDVRQADLSEGTVFYLYTPFTGAILRTVLGLLRHQAERRAIRLCTLGPCTEVVAGESWLESDGACDPKRTSLFRSRQVVA